MIGGWSHVNLKSKKVKNLALKAVEKHNSETSEKVVFCDVLSALRQNGGEKNYRLIIKTILKNFKEKTGCIRYLDVSIFQQSSTNDKEIIVEVLKLLS